MQEYVEAVEQWNGSYDPVWLGKRWKMLSDLDQIQHARLNARMYALQKELVNLVHRYAMPLEEEELALESRVALAVDMEDLLRLADVQGDDPLRCRKRFEARRFFDLTMFLDRIDRIDPIERVRRDLSRMIHLFEHHLFLPGSENIQVWTYHDPTRAYRVAQIGINRQLFLPNERYNPMTCRLLAGTQDGRVLFHHRDKDTFGACLKILKQRQDRKKADPFDVRDRRGFALVVSDLMYRDQLIDKLQQVVTSAGGKMRLDASNSTGDSETKMDPNNPHTSEYFRATKFEILWNMPSEDWQKFPYEIIIFTFADYFSQKFSLGLENHDLYRLEQMLDVYFPILFPSSVYQTVVDWKDTSIRELLRKCKRAKLGWKINGRNH
ncbi:MAG: hypothetical protein UU48_C0002G0012 [Candidatus Uhrbacteria bacterium GW2011_GWF2_41_16]|uniref:Uncharacterized protein n=2 Tax=Candidatus Uhriibacteriota TaxID=1752732 RepID=A0A0G0YDT3_9BACT|nr:MAG: hypothetical protein UU31_C0003G0020 [Candidatus Uhrbacteria bacterium GW2011_GWA2_41_10]KKR87293.1 MAG: hypothetical protein UU35_C0004G0066 [Candidatus Uhrbacteria bacterium GW2011_GWC2_41_11]KKR98477.1 MAG: hypothetical protein UU48_C0002G0012 [Candidatus Uhrbacteria bacterium GW2011_GWF2_41_16]HBO99988.1 hypothetical protein [Candidatus Uhrbacteria bacterium]